MSILLICLIVLVLFLVVESNDKVEVEKRIVLAERSKLEKLKKELVFRDEGKEFAKAVVNDLVASYKKETDMALTQDNLNFTINFKEFVRAALNDPKCAEELYQAIQEGPAPVNVPLGSTSAPTSEGEEPSWFSLFIGTNQGAKAGQPGYISRTKKGDRIVARLRKQSKEHVAHATLNVAHATPNVATEVSDVPNVTETLAEFKAELKAPNVTAEQLIAMANAGDAAAAQAILDILAQANEVQGA